ncbi:MAG TPA: hypothetical protein VF057_06400 [Thermoanaerobaculia bacterium]
MDQNFGRTLVVTIVTGLLIGGTGATLLYFAFRAVAEGRAGEKRYIGLAITLIAFVFICCAAIFFVSFR